MDEEQLRSEMEFARRVEEGEMPVEEQISYALGNIGHELGSKISVVYRRGNLVPKEIAKQRNLKPEEIICVILFKDLSLLMQIDSAMQLLNTKDV